MKWVVSNLRPETISAVLSALIYDEENFIDNVRVLFDFEAHCFTDNTGRFFFAVVIDKSIGRIFIVFRGTDGRNVFGKALSWLTNLSLASDKEGYHPGFRSIAEDAVFKLRGYIRNAIEIFVSGHSQGGGVTVAFIMLLCRKIRDNDLPNLRRFEADMFCTPPAVNATGKKEIDEYLTAGYVYARKYIMKGDLIEGLFLRQKQGLLAGRDVGSIIVLIDLIHKKYKLFDVVSHSPTLVLQGFSTLLLQKYEQGSRGDQVLINHIIQQGYLVN